MHQVAEYGVAAHWRYKEGVRQDQKFDAKVAWLRQLMDWQKDVAGGAQEFVDSLKTDIFQDQVYVFTPKGEIKELPSGATSARLRVPHPHRRRAQVRRRQGQWAAGIARYASCKTATSSRSSPPRARAGRAGTGSTRISASSTPPTRAKRSASGSAGSSARRTSSAAASWSKRRSSGWASRRQAGRPGDRFPVRQGRRLPGRGRLWRHQSRRDRSPCPGRRRGAAP